MLRRRVGHYAPYIISACLLAAMAYGQIMMSLLYMTLIGVILLVTVLGAWWCLRAHDRALCETCISSMPLDAGQMANRKKFFLKTAHIKTAYAVIYILVVLSYDVLFAIHPGTEQYILWASLHLPMIVFMYSHVTHMRLQPWCGDCRNGGQEIVYRDRVMS